MVSKVVFGLHTSFKQPTRTVESPPYEVTETGWGEFDITITVHFQPDANEKPLELAHMLKLYEDGHQQGAPQSTKKPVVSEKYDEVVFLEPEETFHSRLNNHVAMPLATPSTIAPFLPKYDDRAEIAKIQEARRKTAEQKAELEAQVEAVEAEVREEAAVLSRKRISLAGMAYLSNTVILPRVLYKLKFSHASVKQIDKIQSSLLDAAAKKAGLTAAAH